MRIIAGKYKGQIISTPHGHKTHPMSERMRGALFNTLGDIDGLSVLDAYAGTGAVGIEALSRGARNATFIDNDNNANRTILENIKKLNIKNAKTIRANSASWSKLNQAEKFDLIFCDPPYDAINHDSLEQLITNLQLDGLFILSAPKSYERPTFSKLDILSDKSFADGSIIFYKKIKI